MSLGLSMTETKQDAPRGRAHGFPSRGVKPAACGYAKSRAGFRKNPRPISPGEIGNCRVVRPIEAHVVRIPQADFLRLRGFSQAIPGRRYGSPAGAIPEGGVTFCGESC
jgi:hypothetical protein